MLLGIIFRLAFEANDVRGGRFEGGERAGIVDDQLQDRFAVHVGVLGFGDGDGQAGCHQTEGRKSGSFQHLLASIFFVINGITKFCYVIL